MWGTLRLLQGFLAGDSCGQLGPRRRCRVRVWEAATPHASAEPGAPGAASFLVLETPGICRLWAAGGLLVARALLIQQMNILRLLSVFFLLVDFCLSSWLLRM